MERPRRMDGLPPVGTVCLVKNDEDAHEEYLKFCGKTVEIIAHTDGSVGCKPAVFKCVDNDGYYDFHGLVAECLLNSAQSARRGLSRR